MTLGLLREILRRFELEVAEIDDDTPVTIKPAFHVNPTGSTRTISGINYIDDELVLYEAPE